jgi:hypothetical protein
MMRQQHQANLAYFYAFYFTLPASGLVRVGRKPA